VLEKKPRGGRTWEDTPMGTSRINPGSGLLGPSAGWAANVLPKEKKLEPRERKQTNRWVESRLLKGITLD